MHERDTEPWKEARRLQAWHLKQTDWPQRQIADLLALGGGAASQGIARVRAVGPAALRHGSPLAPHDGCPPHNSPGCLPLCVGGRRPMGLSQSTLNSPLHCLGDARGLKVTHPPGHIGWLRQALWWGL
jgi:hypothetical protein